MNTSEKAGVERISRETAWHTKNLGSIPRTIEKKIRANKIQKLLENLAIMV